MVTVKYNKVFMEYSLISLKFLLGPLNARSNKSDVVTKEELEYYKLVNGIVSCAVGVLCALVLYKLIKKIVLCTTKK